MFSSSLHPPMSSSFLHIFTPSPSQVWVALLEFCLFK
ncbi:hypothetical protein GYH30_011123 [Glycine max]|nr:hypothetical protein GYH30_011123 [Glycine max]